jgi:hypothetical protein
MQGSTGAALGKGLHACDDVSQLGSFDFFAAAELPKKFPDLSLTIR